MVPYDVYVRVGIGGCGYIQGNPVQAKPKPAAKPRVQQAALFDDEDYMRCSARAHTHTRTTRGMS